MQRKRDSGKKDAAIAMAQLQAVEEEKDLDFLYEPTESDTGKDSRVRYEIRTHCSATRGSGTGTGT